MLADLVGVVGWKRSEREGRFPGSSLLEQLRGNCYSAD